MQTSNPNLSSRSEKTRSRLLKITESIFANRGFGGLTLREVAQRSQTNLASAHYHFGSKEAMVLEMHQKRSKPINQRRMQYLAEARERSAGKPLSTRDILRALILPIGKKSPRIHIPVRPWLNWLPELLRSPPNSSKRCIENFLVNYARNSWMNYEKPTPRWMKRIYTGIYISLFHPCWGLWLSIVDSMILQGQV